MALPTIPTSFVPYAASSTTRRFRTDFTGAFGFLCYGVFAVVFAAAVGVFLYGRILAGSQAAKDAQLAKAQASIDLNTVESFVQLHDRLLSGETLLKQHVAASGFFSILSSILPASVRFASLHLTFSDTEAPKIIGTGTAKNFNALAAVSTAFATDGRIKDAIFSGINVSSKDGSVSFDLSATLDPKSVVFSVSSPSTSGTSALPTGNRVSTPPQVSATTTPKP